MSELLQDDAEILWLVVLKVGSPPAWQPNTNYNIGDIVVPIAPQVGQENLAFQVVGFLAKSASSQPVFPLTVGNTILDNQVEWKCVDPAADPSQLKYNEYYLISQTVTV